MNIRKIISLTLAFVLMLAIGANAKTLEFTMKSDTMYESGEEFKAHTLENAPYVKDGRTMVPVRIISESFGAKVDWNGDKREVSIAKDGKNIVLTIGNKDAMIDGEAVTLDVAPEILNSKTMVPLRFVSETLGMNVKYIPSTEQVVINDKEGVLIVNGDMITLDDYMSVMTFMGYTSSAEPLEFVEAATNIFKKIYGSASIIKNQTGLNGTVPKDYVAQNLSPYAELIYSSNVLTAPIADILEKEYYTLEYVDSVFKTEQGVQILEKEYKEKYITAKHILIQFGEDRTEAKAKKEAEAILKKLKSGADFDKLMNEYCEDPGLAQNPNGYTFTTGEMVQEFEDAAFALKEGEISGLVKTSYGYHIIKREALADMDEYTAYYLYNNAAQNFYNELMLECEKESEIKMSMTNEEIAKIIKLKYLN